MYRFVVPPTLHPSTPYLTVEKRLDSTPGGTISSRTVRAHESKRRIRRRSAKLPRGRVLVSEATTTTTTVTMMSVVPLDRPGRVPRPSLPGRPLHRSRTVAEMINRPRRRTIVPRLITRTLNSGTISRFLRSRFTTSPAFRPRGRRRRRMNLSNRRPPSAQPVASPSATPAGTTL